MPRAWHAGYMPFQEVGAETFIAVAPSHNSLWTCEPEAVLQISRSKDEFSKPVKALSVLNVYGPTVTATDGEESRLYRRIVGPSFNDKTYAAVWRSSIEQVERLLGIWQKNGKDGLVPKLGEDMARMTLYIMSKVCFGRNMSQTEYHDSKEDEIFHEQSQKFSGLAYSQALSEMLENVITIFLLPMVLLKISPLTSHKKAWRSFTAWRHHMHDLRLSCENKLVTEPATAEKPNLLESLVLAASGPDPLIDERALQGNMFIFLLAGHETTASTLQFAILCLACNPQYQRRLQSSLDIYLNGKSSSTWSLENDFPRLLRGYPGAVIRETIRLFTVLPFYLRWTGNVPRPLVLQGKTYMVPSDTLVLVDISATHRNPKYWPRPKIVEDLDGEEMPYALSEYDPGRWLNPQTGEVDEARTVKTAGAYVPFSRGSRECMGRRFAEIELVAMMSTIFRDWSVELDIVGEVGADDRTRWENARRKVAKSLSRGIGFGVALKMMSEVPIRVVRRGAEKHSS